MATDFGSYLFESMTPEQQAAYIVRAQAEQEANGGNVLQAPAIAYQQPWTQPKVNQEKSNALAAYQETWNAVAAEAGHQNVGSDPRVKKAAEELRRRQGSADLLGQYGGDGAYATPEQRAQSKQDKLVSDADVRTREAIAQLGAQGAQTFGNNNAAIGEMGRLIDAQNPRNAAFVSRTNDLATELGGQRDIANNGSLAALGTYTSGLNGLNARNDAAISKLSGTYDQLRTPLTANLQSQAAIADPQALAAQNEALGMLGGTANGALDYQSQAAGAYADPKYVAMRDQGLEDLYGVSQGSKDVHVGQEDPKAYAAAMDALEKASAGTNPAVTDAENFLYEQARQGWEMDQRALDSAKMSNLRRRGMAGGGAELTQNSIGNQQIAQQRVLSDLAASAQAVSRAQGMLQLQGQLSSQLNSEGNALAVGNASRQLQALGMYEQGSEVAQQASFDQEYSRGVAADNASANNQSTRLQGQVAYGNQANAMQDDAYNRGVAYDQMQQYNKNFEVNERDALWGRSTDLAGMDLNASSQNSNNLTNAFQGTTSVLGNNFVRDNAVVSAKDLASARQNQGEQTELGQKLGVQGAAIGVNNVNQGQLNNLTGLGIQNTQFTTPLLLQNNQVAMAGAAANKAALSSALATAREQDRADSTGIFGLPVIGSKKGLLGGFGIGQPSLAEQEAEIKARYGG